MNIRQWARSRLAASGLHGYTHASLPTGVNWLHDVARGGLLPPQPVCFDVGANVGQTVMEMHAALPQALIHAFEPFAQPWAQLQALCARIDGARAVQVALGAAPGQAQLAAHPQSVLSSLRTPAPVAPGVASECIRIDTVDAYCQAQGLTRIDLLKTDTEGYDLEVLRGAEGLLRAQQVLYVYCEVTFDRSNTQNTPFQPVFEHLQARGYRFLGLYETYPLHHFAAPNLFCNALFVAGRHWKAAA